MGGGEHSVHLRHHLDRNSQKLAFLEEGVTRPWVYSYHHLRDSKLMP